MVTGKNQNTNTEQEKNQELKDLYPDMIMDKIKMVNDRLNQFFDILHRLIENPYRFKSADRLLEFSLKFKSKIEIPKYMSEIIFDADNKEIIRITGIEIKGSSVFFDYEINNNDGYRYFVDFGADKLVSKEYVIFKYVFEHIDYNDFMELNDVISDIIMEIDNERKYILNVLGNKSVKMEK
jgi:hypothetical protein